MEKEILEGNKLIKDFYTNEHIRGQFGRILSADEYKYHFSWDWLMPVVEKIEQSSRVDIYGKACRISQPQWDVDIAHIDEYKIKAVWRSVIDFIHFYNTQSKVNPTTSL